MNKTLIAVLALSLFVKSSIAQESKSNVQKPPLTVQEVNERAKKESAAKMAVKKVEEDADPSVKKVNFASKAQEIADRHKWPVFIDPKAMDLLVKEHTISFSRIDLDFWSLLETYHPNSQDTKAAKPLHVIIDGEEERVIITALKPNSKSIFEVVEKASE